MLSRLKYPKIGLCQIWLVTGLLSGKNMNLARIIFQKFEPQSYNNFMGIKFTSKPWDGMGDHAEISSKWTISNHVVTIHMYYLYLYIYIYFYIIYIVFYVHIVYVYVHIYIYKFVYIYMCIYIHIISFYQHIKTHWNSFTIF